MIEQEKSSNVLLIVSNVFNWVRFSAKMNLLVSICSSNWAVNESNIFYYHGLVRQSAENEVNFLANICT